VNRQTHVRRLVDRNDCTQRGDDEQYGVIRIPVSVDVPVPEVTVPTIEIGANIKLPLAQPD